MEIQFRRSIFFSNCQEKALARAGFEPSPIQLRRPVTGVFVHSFFRLLLARLFYDLDAKKMTAK